MAGTTRDWSINAVAREAGTTSRTLRHYDDIGLLTPSRTGAGGQRFYDRDAVVRLQQILLLRELGLGLPVIAEVLSRQRDVAAALRTHVSWLDQERRRIDRQIRSVESTLATLTDGGEITMETMLDGFDNSRYEEEVRERWGDEAWRSGADWWAKKSTRERGAFMGRATAVNDALREAAQGGLDPADDAFQQAVADHHAWLAEQPFPGEDRAAYLALADMYVADPRFAAVYGGAEAVLQVREAIGIWAEANPVDDAP